MGLTFGVFLIPMMDEFGWSRGQTAQGVSIGLLGFTFAQPLMGRLISRFGAKRIIIASASCFGLGLWTLSFSVTGARTYYLCTLIIGLVAGGTSPLPYGTILSRWFRRRRGRALSVALCGLGLGGIVLPLLASSVIAEYGWRLGFAVLGTLVIAITVPTVGLVVRNTPEEMGLLPDGDSAAPPGVSCPGTSGPGLSLRQALRTRTFWAMAGGFYLITTATQGTAVHLAPLVVDRGFSLTLGAFLVSTLSLGFLPGLLLSGYLIDRYSARKVAVGFFGIAVLAFTILGQASGWYGLMLSTALLGVSIGATIQLIPTLVGWCFGLRSFSEIYGFVMVAFGLGTVSGPLLLGWLWDYTGSYTSLPSAGGSTAALAVCLIGSIRRCV